jgi:hypothetical protein
MTDDVRSIQETAADYYGITVELLLSKQRRHAIVHPRQIAMWLCSQLTKRSFPDIGSRFGGMDHTTVMYARGQVDARIEADPDLKQETDVLILLCRARLTLEQAGRLALSQKSRRIPVDPRKAVLERIGAWPPRRGCGIPGDLTREERLEAWKAQEAKRRANIRYPASQSAREPSHEAA